MAKKKKTDNFKVAPLADQIDEIKKSIRPAKNVHPVLQRKRSITKSGRQETLRRERENFAQVLGHEEFRRSPFETIARHLSNVVSFNKGSHLQ